MKRQIVCDIETDSLNPTVVWVVGCKDMETGDVKVFTRPDLNPRELCDYMEGVGLIVGHNFLVFDLPVLHRLVPGFSFDPRCVVDTLVVSKLLHYRIEDGHSLELWGKRLGFPKPEIEDFSVYTEDLIERVIGDVEITEKLYLHYKKYIDAPEWQLALRVEHESVLICLDMQKNGFYFDINGAKDLYREISDKVKALEVELQAAFPPRSRLVREVTPRATKHGTLNLQDFRFLGPSPNLSAYSAGSTFSLFKYEPFNPGSPSQVVERLNESGWKPFEKTKGHITELRKRQKRDKTKLAHYKEWGWKVSEANLETLPEDAPPAARKLKDYLTLLSRQRKFEEWFGVYNAETHRIHGVFNHIGAWTHRMAHSAPNMGNNVALDKKYGTEMRKLWQATPGRVLIGVDMASAHLRLFAHYINDPEFTKALLSGDPHTINARALGLDPEKSYKLSDGWTGRSIAKRFIYSFLNGAGDEKVASILNCSKEEAKVAIQNFEEFYPGFGEMKRNQIPFDAARGFFIGLDGRKVMWDSEHGMMPGYLQNGEVVVMKHANVMWRQELDRLGVPYWQLNFVHDEWQTETVDEEEVRELIIRVQVESIVKVGENFGLLCPLAGTSKYGYTWAETH